MYWPDEEPEPMRLAVLALLVGYDRAASHLAGVARTVEHQPYSGAETTLMGSASRLERHIAWQLRQAIDPVALCQLLRLSAGAPGEERFASALTALAKPSIPWSPHEIGLDGIDQLRARQNAGIRAAYRAEILPALAGVARADSEAILRRIEAAAAVGPPAIRTEVVDLLIDRRPRLRADVHADGRLFTDAESYLIRTATDKEQNEADNLRHANFEIDVARQGRYVRLRQILGSAPVRAWIAFGADLNRRRSPAPNPGNAPLRDVLRARDDQDAAFAAAFRQHVLPRLDPDLCAEASTLIEELDPLGDL